MHWQFGDYRVTRIEESLMWGMHPKALLPDCNDFDLAQQLHWLSPRYFDSGSGRFISSVHSWLIQGNGVCMLVDTCGGNCKQRPSLARYHMQNTHWIDHLKQAGVKRHDVNLVLCTHLHADHCGWNTYLNNGIWEPTFPKAQYLFDLRELAYLRSNHDVDQASVLADSIQPILDAGLARAITAEPFHITKDLVVLEALGHSAGHRYLELSNGGAKKALFIGDAIHHPIQIMFPEWSSSFCSDPILAATTRLRLLENAADSGALIMPAHFGWPHAAYIQRQVGGGFTPVFPNRANLKMPD